MQDPSCFRVSSKFNFGPAEPDRFHYLTSLAAEMKSAEEEAYSYTPNVTLSLPLGMGNPCLPGQYHTLQASPLISPCHQGGYNQDLAPGYYLAPGRPTPALESPRIEITTYGQFPEEEEEEENSGGGGGGGSLDHLAKRGVGSIVTLSLPNADGGYRDPSCLSPASSVSSRSCNSEASSYESGFYNYDNSPQTSPWQSPCVSPKGSSSALLSCPPHPAATASPPQQTSPSTSPQVGAVAEEGWAGQQQPPPRPQLLQAQLP